MKDEQLRRFLSHLGRGGQWQYWWTLRDKRSTWWRVDAPRPLPASSADVYFGVCPTGSARGLSERSTAETVVALNALWADFDAKDPRFGGELEHALQAVDSLPHQPSIVVASGNGYHAYWLLEDPVMITADNRDQVAQTVRDWAAYVGGDKAAADLARVLRVPGTTNAKYRPARRVEWVRYDMALLYNFQRLRTACVPQDAVQPAPRPLMPMITRHDSQTRAEAALRMLGLNRADEYSDWLRVGMALHAELGDAGLYLWDQWSRQSAKYQDGECERKWRSFSGSGVGFGTVVAMAREDSPIEYAQCSVLHRVSPITPGALIEQPMPEQDDADDDPPLRAVTTADGRTIDGREGYTAADLQNAGIPHLRWIVDELLPEGVTLLAAKPKAKKSWLALGLGLAVTQQGGRALGSIEIEDAGDVLYLDLEGNARRMHDRINSILGKQRGVSWPHNFVIYNEWPRDLDAIARLTEYARGLRRQGRELRLVVVDLLAEIRNPIDPKQSSYDYDRTLLKALNQWAERHGVAVLAIHHTRKAKGDDVFDEVSGTLGINGAVSSMLILAPNPDGTTSLHRRGRDMTNEDPLTLKWDAYLTQWVIDADVAAGMSVSDSRRAILNALGDGPLTPRQIADSTNIVLSAVDKQLMRMLQSGLIIKPSYGKYSLSSLYFSEKEREKESQSSQSGQSSHTRQTRQTDTDTADNSDTSDGLRVWTEKKFLADPVENSQKYVVTPHTETQSAIYSRATGALLAVVPHSAVLATIDELIQEGEE